MPRASMTPRSTTYPSLLLGGRRKGWVLGTVAAAAAPWTLGPRAGLAPRCVCVKPTVGFGGHKVLHCNCLLHKSTQQPAPVLRATRSHLEDTKKIMVHGNRGTCIRWQQEGVLNQRMGVNQCTVALFLPRTCGHAVPCTRNSSAHSSAPKKPKQRLTPTTASSSQQPMDSSAQL